MGILDSIKKLFGGGDAEPQDQGQTEAPAAPAAPEAPAAPADDENTEQSM